MKLLPVNYAKFPFREFWLFYLWDNQDVLRI